MRRLAMRAVALALLGSLTGCGPTQGDIARGALLAGPVALVAGFVLVRLLHLGWRKIDPQLAFSARPWALTFAVLVVAAILALLGGGHELIEIAPLALVLAGTSILTAILVSWRALLSFESSVAFRWCHLAAILILLPAPVLLVVPENDLAFGLAADLWILPGYMGIATGIVLAVLVVEVLVREKSGTPGKMAVREHPIDLRHSLGIANSFRFPLQSAASRRDILVGGLWLFVPVVGWLLNMGHRIRVVHRMHKGVAPWPAWDDPLDLLKHGCFTFLGMMWYGWPGVGLAALGLWKSWPVLVGVGALLWALAVVAIPGYMTHYCKELDPREIFDPFRALRRVGQGGRAYWKAWSIVIPAMLLSFLGLLGFGFWFNFTSVWFWQVAAFSFATVFTQRFELQKDAPPA